jgi:hypothetical protein
MSENVPDTIAGITRSKFLALIVWSLVVACLILVVCWAFHRDCAFLVPSWRFCGAHFVTSDLYAWPWCCVSCFRWHLEKTSGLSRPNRLPKPAIDPQIPNFWCSFEHTIWCMEHHFWAVTGIKASQTMSKWNTQRDLAQLTRFTSRRARSSQEWKVEGLFSSQKNTRNFISPKLDQTHMRRCT